MESNVYLIFTLWLIATFAFTIGVINYFSHLQVALLRTVSVGYFVFSLVLYFRFGLTQIESQLLGEQSSNSNIIFQIFSFESVEHFLLNVIFICSWLIPIVLDWIVRKKKANSNS